VLAQMIFVFRSTTAFGCCLHPSRAKAPSPMTLQRKWGSGASGPSGSRAEPWPFFLHVGLDPASQIRAPASQSRARASTTISPDDSSGVIEGLETAQPAEAKLILSLIDTGFFCSTAPPGVRGGSCQGLAAPAA
jgi:hypothetical protein